MIEDENELRYRELDEANDKLEIERYKLSDIDKKLEETKFNTNTVMRLSLSSSPVNDVNLVVEKVKNNLPFLADELSALTVSLPQSPREALWSLLSILQDFCADLESQKTDVLEEIKKLEQEIEQIKAILGEENTKER